MYNNGNGINCAPNWLGFSLSPNMKMKETEHNHHHFNTSLPSTVSTGFYASSASSSYAENGAFHSPLSVMPLKSDGSLCIMEALSNSQSLQGNKGMLFSLNIDYSDRTCVCIHYKS